jgi:SAM-dependent methyltransferase
MSTERITFSFGQNWKKFLDEVSEDDVTRAREDIEHWLGSGRVAGKTVIDIGSGSGLHSLCFHLLGAKTVHSFDYDEHSVEATQKMHAEAGSPPGWRVERGSVLDRAYLGSLGRFDIVYSWGVLHHTGAMWEAIENTLQLVAPGGVLWISLYKKGPHYERDLALKRRYNAASEFEKKYLIGRRILRLMLRRLKRGQNPFAWNEKRRRGMNKYHDIVDWLGGLPYETAAEDEVVRYMRTHGLVLERIRPDKDGGCSVYVFSMPGAPQEG